MVKTDTKNEQTEIRTTQPFLSKLNETFNKSDTLQRLRLKDILECMIFSNDGTAIWRRWVWIMVIALSINCHLSPSCVLNGPLAQYLRSDGFCNFSPSEVMFSFKYINRTTAHKEEFCLFCCNRCLKVSQVLPKSSHSLLKQEPLLSLHFWKTLSPLARSLLLMSEPSASVRSLKTTLYSPRSLALEVLLIGVRSERRYINV